MSNSSGKPSRIVLRGDSMRKEGAAGASITPGSLVKRNSSNAWVLGSAADEVGPIFAVNPDHLGKDISTAIASGDRMVTYHANAGDEVYALVPAAASAIVIGDFLQAGASGTLIKRTSTNKILAIALEAVDNSGGGSAVRIRAEVM